MSVYGVTEIIGTSSTSWEDAAAEAIRTALPFTPLPGTTGTEQPKRSAGKS